MTPTTASLSCCGSSGSGVATTGRPGRLLGLTQPPVNQNSVNRWIRGQEKGKYSRSAGASILTCLCETTSLRYMTLVLMDADVPPLVCRECINAQLSSLVTCRSTCNIVNIRPPVSTEQTIFQWTLRVLNLKFLYGIDNS